MLLSAGIFLSFVLLVSENMFELSGQELQCNEPHSVPLCPGDVIISTCRIQSPVLLWNIETEGANYEIDFTVKNNIGDMESDGAFSANLTKHYPDPSIDVSESILQFKFTTELNGTTIICPNLFNQSLSADCVIGNSGIPGNVGNIKTVPSQKSSCDISISWDKPDTGSLVDHYVISMEPQTNQCGMQGCDVSTNQLQLTGLENGVNYDISVSACNCFACGTVSVIQNVAINLTKPELIEHLTIGSPSYSVKKVDHRYAVTLFWEWVQCVTSYSVKVTYIDVHMGENTNSTPQSSFSTHPTLTRGSEFNVSVAGVNGNVNGPYSPELCIELEVPGHVVMINSTQMSSEHLMIKWEPPINVSCTRPTVDYYIVDYDGNRSVVLNTKFLINLTSTMKSPINVTIIPVNIIGTGIPKTTQVSVNGAVTNILSTVNLIVVIIGLLTVL